MLSRFSEAVTKGDAKAAFKMLFNAEQYEVVECLYSVGVTSFSGSKEQMIDANTKAVLAACSTS